MIKAENKIWLTPLIYQLLIVTPDNSPYTIYCIPYTINRYGMGRAGAFLALCICLERMKVENVVDVFQTVRTMRSQRPIMVNTTVSFQQV